MALLFTKPDCHPLTPKGVFLHDKNNLFGNYNNNAGYCNIVVFDYYWIIYSQILQNRDKVL